LWHPVAGFDDVRAIPMQSIYFLSHPLAHFMIAASSMFSKY